MPIPLRSYSQSSTRFFFFFFWGEQSELGYSILFSLSFHVKSVTGGRVGGNIRIPLCIMGFWLPFLTRVMHLKKKNKKKFKSIGHV